MKIQSLPTIHEQPVQWQDSSQAARIEGSWHKSEAPDVLHAARIERAVKSAPAVAIRQTQPVQATQIEPSKALKRWKTFCHTAAAICGVLAMPALACIAFAPIGVIIPAALLVASVVFALMGGKLTQEMEAQRAAMAAQNAAYDPR